jgi:hypothetical protein
MRRFVLENREPGLIDFAVKRHNAYIQGCGTFSQGAPMRGMLFIGLLIAVVIVAYLTIARLKSRPAAQIPGAVEAQIQGTLTELPKQVRNKVQDALDRSEQQRKEAEKALQ